MTDDTNTPTPAHLRPVGVGEPSSEGLRVVDGMLESGLRQRTRPGRPDLAVELDDDDLAFLGAYAPPELDAELLPAVEPREPDPLDAHLPPSDPSTELDTTYGDVVALDRWRAHQRALENHENLHPGEDRSDWCVDVLASSRAATNRRLRSLDVGTLVDMFPDLAARVDAVGARFLLARIDAMLAADPQKDAVDP